MRDLLMDPTTHAEWSALLRSSALRPEQALTAEAATQIVPARRSVGSVAIVGLRGIISQRPTLMSLSFGGTSTAQFAREVVTALADPAVGAVVMDVDSPGGQVFGVPEAAAVIRAARGGKPLVAVTNGLNASAAYWLSSQASEIVSTPSGLTGSIGIYVAHEDLSAALEQKGSKVSLISYGRRKTEGSEFGPLDDETRAAIQARVDEFGEMFVRDVAKGRGVPPEKVRTDFGEGAVLTASQAVAAGMVDRIATLDEVVGALARGYQPAKLAPRAYDETELRARAALAGLDILA